MRCVLRHVLCTTFLVEIEKLLVAVIATGVVAICTRWKQAPAAGIIFVPLHSSADAEWERRLFLARYVTGVKIREACCNFAFNSLRIAVEHLGPATTVPLSTCRDLENAPRGLLDIDAAALLPCRRRERNRSSSR